MGSIITLTTDFALADAYIAAMKRVILGINPAAYLHAGVGDEKRISHKVR